MDCVLPCMLSNCGMRSFPPRVALTTSMSDFNVPETTRTYARCPAYGSTVALNTNPLNGAAAFGSTLPPSSVATAPTSAGDGSNAVTPSNKLRTPTSFSAQPQ